MSPNYKSPTTLRNNLANAKAEIAAIRRAVADYMSSEGCSCCQNVEAHTRHKEALGKLLRVPKYDDGSGYDFGKFRSVGGSTNG